MWVQELKIGLEQIILTASQQTVASVSTASLLGRGQSAEVERRLVEKTLATIAASSSTIAQFACCVCLIGLLTVATFLRYGRTKQSSYQRWDLKLQSKLSNFMADYDECLQAKNLAHNEDVLLISFRKMLSNQTCLKKELLPAAKNFYSWYNYFAPLPLVALEISIPARRVIPPTVLDCIFTVADSKCENRSEIAMYEDYYRMKFAMIIEVLRLFPIRPQLQAVSVFQPSRI